MKLPFIIFLLLIMGHVNAQNHFNTQRNWSLNKKEILFGVGATQFLGDLGGRDKIGKDYSLADINLPSTSFGGMIGFRYRFKPQWATTTTFNVGMLKGSDALTNEVIRHSRNLHFQSLVLELSQRIEWILFSNEKFGARYRIPGKKFVRDKNDQIYLFTGVGINYFNAKANFNGEWVSLRKLHTEGQGLPDGPKNYLPITATIPFGIGARIGISRMWRIGIEATYVKTFSDYIDDVSGVYYDPSIIAQNYGQAAGYLSNPSSENSTWFTPGQQRGDKQKDAYFYLNIVFTRNITYKEYGKQRRSTQWGRSGGRYKF